MAGQSGEPTQQGLEKGGTISKIIWRASTVTLPPAGSPLPVSVQNDYSLWEPEPERPRWLDQIALACWGTCSYTIIEELLKLHTTSPVHTGLNPQLYVLSNYPLLTLEKTVPRYQDLKLESQENNGIYLFVMRCWIPILNLQPFRPPTNARWAHAKLAGKSGKASTYVHCEDSINQMI